MTKVYRGRIKETSNGEDDRLLGLGSGSQHRPLAEVIADDMEEYGRYLTVRYYVSDEEMSEEELKRSVLRVIFGEGDAECEAQYSETTGYLWTDEELNVGGHDLLAELHSQMGRHLHLEITYAHALTPIAERP